MTGKIKPTADVPVLAVRSSIRAGNASIPVSVADVIRLANPQDVSDVDVMVRAEHGGAVMSAGLTVVDGRPAVRVELDALSLVLTDADLFVVAQQITKGNNSSKKAGKK